MEEALPIWIGLGEFLRLPGGSQGEVPGPESVLHGGGTIPRRGPHHNGVRDFVTEGNVDSIRVTKH